MARIPEVALVFCRPDRPVTPFVTGREADVGPSAVTALSEFQAKQKREGHQRGSIALRLVAHRHAQPGRGYGTRMTLPVVARDSRAVCAAPASASGKRAPILTSSLPSATRPKISP